MNYLPYALHNLMRYFTRAIITGFLASTLITACSAEPTAEDSPAEAAAVTPIPDWARTNIAYMTAGSGRWVADNAEYKSDAEAWDSYVIEWRAGPDNLSMTARMYGVIDETPSQADFWSFYQYWDRAAGAMRVVQSGWGVVGDGTMQSTDRPRTYLSDQTFTTSTGDANAVRHEMVELSPTEHKTTSYNPSEDGSWTQDRSYVWTRES
jgi:hypothetical protein